MVEQIMIWKGEGHMCLSDCGISMCQEWEIMRLMELGFHQS